MAAIVKASGTNHVTFVIDPEQQSGQRCHSADTVDGEQRGRTG